MPEIVVSILVCLLASLFAGVGTGFVGMSAAVAITPLLMTFLGIDHFEATAIALASDVLASLAATVVYKVNKNTNIRKSWVLFLTVIVFSIIGTIAGYYIPSQAMGWGTIVTIVAIGVKLIFFPSKNNEKEPKQLSKTRKTVYSIVFGALIGFICGFVGAGGGMMLLLVLTVVLGYDMHKAVGTSVAIMALTALIGSASHIGYQGIVEGNLGDIHWLEIGLCVVFTLLFSLLSSRIANKLSNKLISIISGASLIAIALTVILVEVL